MVAGAMLAAAAGSLPAARAADQARPASAVIRQWVEAFDRYGIDRKTLEAHLGHPLDDLSANEAGQLQGLLNRVAQTRNATASKTVKEAPRPALTPEQAGQLGADIVESHSKLKTLLKEIDELVGKMPTHFPPDLKLEEATIGKFLDFVQECKSWSNEFERRSPDLLETAGNYRAKLRSAITALGQGAAADRSNDDSQFGALASTQDVIAQAYAKRLAHADTLYAALESQIRAAKTSQQLLNRWEAVLLLMQPVAKDGSLTQENLARLLEYHRALEQALKSFRAWGDKMRAASEQDAGRPSEKATGPVSPTSRPTDR
jgi:hypothetical protein